MPRRAVPATYGGITFPSLACRDLYNLLVMAWDDRPQKVEYIPIQTRAIAILTGVDRVTVARQLHSLASLSLISVLSKGNKAAPMTIRLTPPDDYPRMPSAQRGLLLT